MPKIHENTPPPLIDAHDLAEEKSVNSNVSDHQLKTCASPTLS